MEKDCLTIEITPDEMPRPDAPRRAKIEWCGQSPDWDEDIVAARYFPSLHSPTCHIVFRAKSGGPNFWLKAPRQGEIAPWMNLALFYARSFEEILPTWEARLEKKQWARLFRVAEGCGLLLDAQGTGSWHHFPLQKPRWQGGDEAGLFHWSRASDAPRRLREANLIAQITPFFEDESSEIGFARRYVTLSFEERCEKLRRLWTYKTGDLCEYETLLRAAIWSVDGCEDVLPDTFGGLWENRKIFFDGRSCHNFELQALLRGRLERVRGFYQPAPPQQQKFLCVKHHRSHPALFVDAPTAHQRLEAALIWENWTRKQES